MLTQKTSGPSVLQTGRVLFLPLGAIRPNPAQPRSVFDAAGLQELAASIRQYGVLQPLSVRKKGSGFELVAGERRLRAAGLAGLREVPCLLVSADDQDAGLLALVENLQRRDLDYIEQAQGLARLSAIANKLRLLKLSEPVLALLRASGLSERHARALLRIEDEAAQLRLVRLIAENGWTVAKTERYIDELCAKTSQKAKLGHFVLRDMRVFFNTINHQLDLIRAAGVDAGTEQRETEHEIVLTIRIPKSACVR